MTSQTLPAGAELDTSSADALARIAALAESDEVAVAVDFANLDRDAVRAAMELERFQRWKRDAIAMARAGIRPGPSHFEVGSEYACTLQGGYMESEMLRHELVSAGMHPFDAPLVVLAFGAGAHDVNLDVTMPREVPWIALTHQSSGIACNQVQSVATPVLLHPEGAGRVARLARFADLDGHDCIGITGVRLGELARYKELCDEVALSAEWSWKLLQEGCSPLDASSENLKKLGAMIGGYSLDEVIDAVSLDSYQFPWSLLVLGPNCD